jgi:hypothetical protein
MTTKTLEFIRMFFGKLQCIAPGALPLMTWRRLGHIRRRRQDVAFQALLFRLQAAMNLVLWNPFEFPGRLREIIEESDDAYNHEDEN